MKCFSETREAFFIWIFFASFINVSRKDAKPAEACKSPSNGGVRGGLFFSLFAPDVSPFAKVGWYFALGIS